MHGLFLVFLGGGVQVAVENPWLRLREGGGRERLVVGGGGGGEVGGGGHNPGISTYTPTSLHSLFLGVFLKSLLNLRLRLGEGGGGEGGGP